jgi:hypothetical protein
MNKILLFIEKYLAAFLVLILGKTLRFEQIGTPPTFRVIYAFWHRNMIPLLYLHRNQKAVIMVSTSKDGQLIAGPAEVLGYQTARGSSHRSGSAALKKMIRLSKEFDLAITPDGPKGPPCRIKEGLLFLAYATGNPILPVSVHIEKESIFNSWDKFRLPLFFSKIKVIYGSPIYIRDKSEIVSKFDIVQQHMTELDKK